MEHWYDYKLVALSMVVAVISAQIALGIASRIKAHRRHAMGWLMGGGTAMGIGIWAMHFVGMLAYHLPIPVGYDIQLTALSLILAIISSMIALNVVLATDKLDWRSNALSAVMMGAGIASMHYTGIYAMQMSPPIEFDNTLFAVSLLIAYVASYFAIRFAFHYSTSETFVDRRKGVASVIMGVAITGMHYTAMAAQRIDPGAVCLAADTGISVDLLSLLVILVVMAILLITGLVLNSDLMVAQKEKQFALRLAEQNRRSLADTERLAVELSRESLRNAEFANKLVDTLGAVVVVMERSGNVVRFNRKAEQLTGFSREEVIDQPIWKHVIPSSYRIKSEAELSGLGAADFPYIETSYWQTKAGELRLIDWAKTALLDGKGEVEFIIASGIDVTEQRANEEELRIAAVAFDTNEAIVVTDAAERILRTNRQFSEITGYEAEEVIGQRPALFKSGRHDEAYYRDMWARLNTHGFWMGEIWNRRKNGEVYPEFLRITAVKDEHGRVKNYVGSFSDISQLKNAEEQLTYISNYDQATGLPNRQLTTELLHKEITQARSTRERGLLFYMRFVQLALLNDSLGIKVVDQYIERFVERVREVCGAGTVLGRASGSGFLLLLPRMEPDYELSTRGSQLAEAIIQFATQGEEIDGHVVRLGLNIGIAAFPQESLGAQEIMQNALVALERAKQSEGSSYQFFSTEMHQAAVDSYRMVVALRSAIANGELALYYQPQVEWDGLIRGAEALLRWRHQGEFVSPAEFIPLAEQSDLIHELGDFVFRQGIMELAHLQQAGLPERFDGISLNMSAKQFQDSGFIDRLKQYLIEFSVRPEMIKIELTESALIDNPQQAIETINRLKELGIRISLDDFGTGYSSLSYLHRLPIDQLKVDQSFVRDITINRISRSITENIIMMANSMEIDVIAEGVETREEMELLSSFGCHHYQGYYFYKPMPAEEMRALLLG